MGWGHSGTGRNKQLKSDETDQRDRNKSSESVNQKKMWTERRKIQIGDREGIKIIGQRKDPERRREK